MFEERDKWLFKIISFIILIITVLVVTFLITGASIDIWNIMSLYGLPVGLLVGWGIVTLSDSRKK